MLRNELDRLPFEAMNDIMERTIPIQGGGAFLVEWDNSKAGSATVGELAVSTLHPKQIIPQDGVYTGVEDMDYIILKIPQTKGYIRRTYGVDVSEEAEEEPDVKGSGGEGTADDMVTQYVAYYRNPDGGIGLFSWVNDTALEDLEDYQARRLRRCARCGAVEPLEAEPVEAPADKGLLPGMTPDGAGAGPDGTHAGRRGKRKVCPYCGGDKWEEAKEEYEEVYVPIPRSDGTEIPGARPVEVVTDTVDELGLPVVAVVQEPTRIPFYKPDIYPVILQKNVSVYGKFLGDSDIDKISDQQNTTNRIEAKIIDKLTKSGSYISLPNDAKIRYDEEDMKKIYLSSPADKSYLDVYDLQGDIEQDMAYQHIGCRCATAQSASQCPSDFLLRRPIPGRPVPIIQLHCKRLDVLAVQISIPAPFCNLQAAPLELGYPCSLNVDCGLLGDGFQLCAGVLVSHASPSGGRRYGWKR